MGMYSSGSGRRRRHGWQRPLHPLQMVAISVFTFLVASFYCFLAPFLGNPIAHFTLLSIFSSLAASVVLLFIRCTATDPSDKTSHRHRHRHRHTRNARLHHGFLLGHLLLSTFRRVERKILKTCIRRNYLTNHPLHLQHLPLLPFPLLTPDDSVSPQPICFFDHQQAEDISFCPLCNLEVKKYSKHCRTCNRCVEGFDHHCHWLNNCVGKKNYTTFILLMISVLLLLVMEGGTSAAVIIRCFADTKRIEVEVARAFHANFPRGLLVAISVVLLLVTAYGAAALGQLFFFHLLLIRKGMRTYDYILALKEQNRFDVEALSDSDFSSDDSSEFASPERPIVMSQLMCKGQRTNPSPGRVVVKIDQEPSTASIPNQNKSFHTGIDPWKLIQMSREKAFMASEQARERLAKEKQIVVQHDSLNPLPLEMKSGPLMKPEKNLNIAGLSLTPLIAKRRELGSPGGFSSPRRRFSGSPASLSTAAALPNKKYRSNFDLKITEVSQELESYISRQVLSTVLKDGTEASPR